MKSSAHWSGLMAAIALLWSSTVAVAQIPPHRPGTICFTPAGWCWVNPPGRPGAFCTCEMNGRPVGGRLN